MKLSLQVGHLTTWKPEVHQFSSCLSENKLNLHYNNKLANDIMEITCLF